MKKYFIKSKIKNNLHTYIFILSFIILNLYIGIKISKKINYQESFIRLHVVANSNSISDQIEKLKISEKINSYIDSLNIPKDTKKEDIMNILKNNSNEILNIANNNSNYSSTLQIGKINYEEKQSILSDMPSGTYDSVKLILGKGDGKNIWSLVFPNEENIQNLKNYETILPGISSIYNNNQLIKKDITYSIKIVEVFNDFFNNK